jgi:hypothetical protein
MAQSDRTSLSGAYTLFVPPTGVDNTYDKKRRVFAVPIPTPGGCTGDSLVSRYGEVGVTTSTEAKVINKYAEFHAEDGEVVQSGTGLYRGVLEIFFEDRWNCNLEMCFRAHLGKRPASTSIPEGSVRSRRSSHLRMIRTRLNCRENAEAARNKLEELRDLTKWIDSFESSTEWNRLISARKSNSARGRTKPGELRSLRDLPKSPPARHVWILEEVTHKSAEEANQQANIHPVEDSEDGRVDSDGVALELGVHKEEVAVKMVMVKSAEGNLEEDAQPPFPTVHA